MFVLGIDPGLSRCGYACLEAAGRARPPRPVALGVLTTPAGDPLPARLASLRADLAALMRDLGPDVVAVERVFFQVNVRTAMSVGQASGLALVAAASAGCAVAQYTSNEVKQALVGYGAATKEQVQRMVAQVLGVRRIEGPPDVADALALAVCHLSTVPLRRAVDAALQGGSVS